MTTALLTIRSAQRGDGAGIAQVHDATWRESYRGIIQGVALERLIESRGPTWWDGLIRRRSGLQVVDFNGTIVGYATYGNARTRFERYPAQIYELYVLPEYQGLGLGRMLFRAARSAFSHGRTPAAATIVWALADNDRAHGFYRYLGGKEIARALETIGNERYETIAFGFG
jgi:ribosomal protein S18 acetylase RimI-like enzyme